MRDQWRWKKKERRDDRLKKKRLDKKEIRRENNSIKVRSEKEKKYMSGD